MTYNTDVARRLQRLEALGPPGKEAWLDLSEDQCASLALVGLDYRQPLPNVGDLTVAQLRAVASIRLESD